MRRNLLLVVLLVATGCPSGGPCSSPSSLFPSPLARASVAADGGVQVDVSWNATTAPASFYASPAVVGNARLVDAGTTGAQLRSDTADVPVAFTLRYVEGETRTCQHVGMDDTYVLSVSVQAPADGGVGTGTVTPSVDLGAL